MAKTKAGSPKNSLKLSDLRQREFRGVSEIAGMLKISPGTISKLERNLETPRPALAKKIAQFFMVDPAKFAAANGWSWEPRPAKKHKAKSRAQAKSRTQS